MYRGLECFRGLEKQLHTKNLVLDSGGFVAPFHEGKSARPRIFSLYQTHILSPLHVYYT
jgi:hypothetical protein